MAFIKNTDLLVEGESNKFFSDELAKGAVVDNSIASGITDKAPSQQSVFNALNLKLDASQVGASGGVASLDAGGKIPSAQLPALALTDVHVVADNAARDLLTVEEGDVAIVTSTGKSWIYDGAGWQELTAAGAVVSVNGETGAVSLDADDISEAPSGVNQYFTGQRAKDAVVVNSSSGTQTDQAMSVSAAKEYSESQADAASGAALSAAEDYTDLAVSGLASEGYADSAAASALSAAENYTDLAVSGLASEQFVNESVSGLASESYVDGAVSGLANKSLSNLDSVAINEDLLFGSDGAKNIGAAGANRPNKEYLAHGIQLGGASDRLGASGASGVMIMVSEGSSATRHEMQYYRNDNQPARFSFRKARGSEASPSAASAADELGRVTFSSMGDAGSFRDSARIAAYAEENATNTSSPGYLQLQVTPTGSTSLAAAVQVNSDKSLQLYGTQQTVPVNFALTRPADTGVDARGYGKVIFEDFTDGSSNNQTQIKFDLRRNSTDGTARLPLTLQTDHAVMGRGLSYRKVRKSANYTIANSEPYQIATASGVVYTMPASPIDGQFHVIKDGSGAGSISILANAGQTIDGASGFDLDVGYESVQLIWDSNLSTWLAH